jgi:hypothetical protein
VGSAYLPEKQRGKTRVATIKGRKLRPTTNDGSGKEPKLHLMEDTLLGPVSYAPNSSQKRRALRTSNVRALRDCPEGIELVGNPKDKWREIGSLRHALAIETLRTTLLILLVIVRLGAA